MAQLAPDIIGPAEIARRIPREASLPPGLRARVGEVVAFVARRFRPECVVLFGSLAYGRPSAASDIDLMVVMETPLGPNRQWTEIREAVAQEFGALRPRFDIKVMTPERVRLGLSENNFFVVDVMTKGVVLVGGGCSDESVAGSGTEHRGRTGPKQVTLEWLAKADDDRRVARMVVDMPDPPLGLACFHAQQCAEKYLKAILQEREIRFPRTHKLEELADLAGGVLPRVSALRPELAWLTEFSVDVRYPEVKVPTPDAERALRVAEAVRAEVRAKLVEDEAADHD